MADEAATVTLGQLALVQAMTRLGHTAAMAAEAIGAKVGTINNVLHGRRGVGGRLGIRLKTVYGVGVELFQLKAPAGTVLPPIPRARRMKEAA